MDSISFKEYSKRTSFKYSIIPVLVIIVLTLTFGFFFIRYVEINNAKNSAENISEVINADVDKIYKKMHDIPDDSVYKSFFKGESSKESVLYDFFQFRKDLNIVPELLVEKNGEIILSTLEQIDKKTNFSKDRNWEEIVDSQGVSFNIKQMRNGKSLRLTLEKQMSIGQEDYRIILELDSGSIAQIMNTESTTINFLEGNFGEVISTNNKKVKGVASKFVGREINGNKLKLADGHYYYSSIKIDRLNIYLKSLYKSYDFSNLLILFILAFIILSGIVLIAINISWKIISEKNNEALDDMIDLIRKPKKGKLVYETKKPVFKEFQNLYDEYNDMVQSVEDLIKKNQQISYLNKVDYLKLLNAQFNPHFLFNTLESLRYLVMFDPKKANEYIIDLSKILRATIDNKGFYSKVRDEVSILESYLRLQKMRYEDRLDYEINVDENILNNDLPKHIIQPIIENSMKYTYMVQDKLSLKIDILDKGEKIRIEIRDNGPGISAEDMEKIRRNLKNYTSEMGIGFYNVNKKLDLLYENYLFNFYNMEDGLFIEIEIEKEKYV